MNAVEKLIDLASAAHDFPGETRATAARLLRDTLAVGIAGSSAPGAEGVRNTALSFGSSDAVAILGTTLKLPAASAAFVNSFQIHCLEWDAVHEAAVVHALSVVTGVLMSIAQQRGDVSDDDFCAALIIGVDIAAGLGLASTGAMRFFRPATAGIIGATLAAARLEKFAPGQMRDAVGIAYAQISGTMQAHVEGSIALPLQIAFAARGAVTAIELVKNGLTGPHDILEGPFGYFRLFEIESDLARYFDALGTRWLMDDISIKPYPTGRAAHATLSALQQLHVAHKFSAEDVHLIDAHLTPLAHRLVGRPYIADMTPAYARLCLPLLCALVVRDQKIDPKLFQSATFSDMQIQSLAAKIHVHSNLNPNPNALSPQSITVTLSDGSQLRADIPHTLGSPENPLSDVQLCAKLELCCSLAVAPLSDNAKKLLIDAPLQFALAG